MTENAWLSADSPEPLLKWLQRSKRYRLSPRKLRLLAVAFGDRAQELIADETTRAALDYAARLADDPSLSGQWREWMQRLTDPERLTRRSHIAVWVLRVWDANWRANTPETSARSVAGYVEMELGATERPLQAALVQDIGGNPFRPVAFAPEWRTPTVLALAEPAYADRAFDRLPVLADALEDAGCDAADLLAHLRGTGPHVRGCWALDLVLGKG